MDHLLDQLTYSQATIDTDRARETLGNLAEDIRSASTHFQGVDYSWILDRLTEIYARGFGRRAQEPFTQTAAAYAQVIETLSHLYPDQDYGEAVGQLFRYMSLLFREQRHSWKTVYKHILSIPDTVEAKRLLNRAYFVEIKKWADAGVENLFSIRQDRYEKIAALAARIERLDRRIERIARELTQGRQGDAAASGSNVIDFAKARRKQLIKLLEHKRKWLLEEKEDEEFVVGVVESDIREFEEKLRNTRRAYFVHTM